MSSASNNREPREPLKMGIYYDIVAGALYLCLAYFLYANPPGGIGAGLAQGVSVVFGLYGIFRVGRGIYRIRNK